MKFQDALDKINSSYFFEEFTFSSNTFKPNPNAQLELADNLVWLDDLMIIYQLKERVAQAGTTAQKEHRWFHDEVVKNATRQVRDTLSYLETYPQIELRNNRGHAFNVATAQHAHAHKLVVYHPYKLLPVGCRLKKHHKSRKGGLIHLIHSSAYLGILETLVTPVEIGEYLRYRERLIERWGDALSKVSEKAVVGHYLRNLPELTPSNEFETLVDKLKQKDKDWDISHMIKVFHERLTTPNSTQEAGYTVLKALAKLYRTEMAEFKKRFRFSMEKTLADEACLPHRFSTSKECGFVFIPLQHKELPNRGKLLEIITALNKYDQKLDRCIGLTFIAEGQGSWCDVQWRPMEFQWEENATLQAALDEHYPFRPVKQRIIERYGLADGG